MADIAAFVADLSHQDIPDKALQSARLCILDAVGCMAGGIQDPTVFRLAEKLSIKNPGSTRIAGTLLTSTRPWASFINSHACSYFDLDDGHRKGQGHPGGVIVPLSLIVAAENGCTGKELLTAVVAGYETAIRSAQIIRKAGGPRKGSGGWTIIGGVAALAKLCRFSQSRIKNALGLAEYYAPQAPQDRSLAYPSSMKEGMAWAAHSAMIVTQLVESGFDGMSPFLCDAPECKDLGTNWEICSSYYKMYACCRFSHPVLDGLTHLFAENDIKSGHIQSIKVTTFAKALLLDHLFPENLVAAMYSIPFIIGCFLTKGKVGIAEMTTDSLNDTEILSIAQKVALEEDSTITDQFPLKCLARVTVALNNGEVMKSDTLSARGDPDNPYSQEELRTKFMEMIAPLRGRNSDLLFQKIMNIDHESPQDIWESLW
jgi:2-methylcitrate dehydratase PrpD